MSFIEKRGEDIEKAGRGKGGQFLKKNLTGFFKKKKPSDPLQKEQITLSPKGAGDLAGALIHTSDLLRKIKYYSCLKDNQYRTHVSLRKTTKVLFKILNPFFFFQFHMNKPK